MRNCTLKNKIIKHIFRIGKYGILLFNGKNSMHRVTKVKSNETRILAVLAYNDKPGVSLSTSAQMTFYGKSEN